MQLIKALPETGRAAKVGEKMARNNKYTYDGKVFTSIKSLAKYTGINEKTLTARLRRGMSVEDSCNPRLLNRRYYVEKGKEKCLAEICREQGKDPELVRNRLNYNYSLNQALNSPKRVARQGMPIVVNGILYRSIAEAVRKLNLENKEYTIRSRLRNGWNVNEAFYFDRD